MNASKSGGRTVRACVQLRNVAEDPARFLLTFSLANSFKTTAQPSAMSHKVFKR